MKIISLIITNLFSFFPLENYFTIATTPEHTTHLHKQLNSNIRVHRQTCGLTCDCKIENQNKTAINFEQHLTDGQTSAMNDEIL